MYIKKFYGTVVFDEPSEKGRLDTYDPPLVEKENYFYWQAIIDDRTCLECYQHHEKIYSKKENPEKLIHPHENCRCDLFFVNGVAAGYATKDGRNGADWWLKNFGILPNYYIKAEELKKLGWKDGDRPSKYAPGKMLTMGTYKNKDGRLPQSPGRIWFEADINYTPGVRNKHRIVWSNDGIIFVTYDHYITFYEIF